MASCPKCGKQKIKRNRAKVLACRRCGPLRDLTPPNGAHSLPAEEM